MRPLTAALALLGGEFELSGVARMHERPIGDLVDALRHAVPELAERVPGDASHRDERRSSAERTWTSSPASDPGVSTRKCDRAA